MKFSNLSQNLTSTIHNLTFNIQNSKFKIQNLLSHGGFRRYSANTAWLFAEQILRMIAGFLVGVWVARYLGPEKFGIFSYSLAFVSLFGGIAKLGLDGIVVRDLVKEPKKREVYLGTSFWLKLFGGTITFSIIIIVLIFQSVLKYFPSLIHNPKLIIQNLTASHLSLLTSYISPLTSHLLTSTNIYILIIAFGIIFQSFEVIDFYYQATVQAKYISIRKMIQLFLSSIIKIILVLVKADLIWFVFVTLFDAISLAIFSWSIYKSQGLPNFIKYFERNTAKRLLKDSWPLVLSSMAIAVYMRIDQVMIKNMLGDREVGLYSAAVKVVEIWYFIPMIITQSVFPAIVNAKKVSEDLYYKRLQQLFSLLIWMAIFISIPISVFSHQIIYLLYGEKFVEASNVLKISIWASLFGFIGTGSSYFFLVENLQKLFSKRVFYGMIVNIILNLILIHSHGIQGAAIATLISQAIAAYLFDIFNKETKKIFFMKTYALIPCRSWRLTKWLK
jgi:O-antigen/teichoic acid export membrane protein